MKTNSKTKMLLSTTLIALFILKVCSESVAQEQSSSDLKEFKITIERTDFGIKLQSDKGSAWRDLGFSISNNKSQAIDEYGTTKLGEVSSLKDPKLTDYLFTITKINEKIVLKSIEGTAWKELSFSLQKNGKQSFDQFGMTE